MTRLSHPFLFAVMCARNSVVIRVRFGAVLGLCFVEMIVCMTIGSGCDKMNLNSLYWDVDAPIAHPFCTRITI